jgi:co-chaperonin GroES (HSP10)
MMQEGSHLVKTGVTVTRERTDVIFEGETLRPLRDHIIVKPLETFTSQTLHVVRNPGQTHRGVIVAAGPGCFPWKYNGDRSKRWPSKVFKPTQVRVGDVVQFGGLENGGYKFPQVLYKGETHFIAREEDVTGIESLEY